MSRRRPTPPEPAAWSDGTEIRVICTDKGQHAEVSFGHVRVSKLGNGWRVTPYLQHRGDEYVDMDAIAAVERGQSSSDRLSKTYPLKCRRCGRDRPLRIDTLEKICPAFAEANMPTLDISDMT